MAGLLAAQMLRRHDPVVCEAAPSLPDNHGALLRFRTDVVARAVHQQFKKVSVTKGVADGSVIKTSATIPDTNHYAYKVTGKVQSRSIMNLDPVERYIAPDDFISELGRFCNVVYEYPMTLERVVKARTDDVPVVSTIPMPALMDILGWPDKPEFHFLPIWTITAQIVAPVTEVYQTLYYVNTADLRYRASITGNRLIVEFTKEIAGSNASTWLNTTKRDFGLPENTQFSELRFKFQQYGKLNPIDERVRKDFVLWATDTFGVYSVGRFATWRQLLLDDVVNDIQVVDRFITQRDSYARRLQSR